MTKNSKKPTNKVKEDLPQSWNKNWEDFIKRNPPKTNKAKK